MGLFGGGGSKSKVFITQEDRRVAAQDNAIVLSEGATLTSSDRSITNIERADADVIDAGLSQIFTFGNKLIDRSQGITEKALQLADTSSDRVVKAIDDKSANLAGIQSINKTLIAVAVVGAAAFVLAR